MNPAARLGLYAAGLVLAFGVAYGVAGAVVPDSVVTNWLEQSSTHDQNSGDHGTGGHQ